MFTNLSGAQQTSVALLSRFGKNTNILMDVHAHRINVRRANDNALIARLYVAQYGDDFIYQMVEPDHYSFTSIDSLAWQVMAAAKFPQIDKRERNWSPIVNKEVEGAY